MKRFDWRWLAVSSFFLVLVASAETRPQYGGTLRVDMRGSLASLDPADSSQPNSVARRSLTMLMFDTLVTIDENGHIQPSLAVSWQASSGSRRWLFRLRHGVKFDDGTLLTAEIVASSLRTANASWNVQANGDSVLMELAAPDSELLTELALPRNAIVKRNVDNRPSGTGPFHAVDWQAGKKLILVAAGDYWGGRPFLDSIEIEMSKSSRDQMTALELSKADLVEVPAEQLHRISLEGRRLVSSQPSEFLAVVFTSDAASADDKTLREALALSIDRGSIRNVLLQGTGQSAASILPNWMSGYGFVFSTDADLPRARHAREQVHSIPTWMLGYDGSDPLARLLAERIALNAKDAGLSVQPTTALTADLRLARIPMSSADPWIALADVAALAGISLAKRGGSVEDLYATEQAVLVTQRLIPLFHLPASYAAASSLNDLKLRPDGSWDLADAWLGGHRP